MAVTLLYRAACLLSPDCPNRALANLLDRRRGTVRAWLSGRRSMPLELYAVLQQELEERIRMHHAMIQELKAAAWFRQRERPRPLQGFFVVKERDGPGSVPRDARNRLGRPKKSL
jgi:hypothetical protein